MGDSMKKFGLSILSVLLLGGAMTAGISSGANASTVTFVGQDNASAVGGPIPNSVAARDAFVAAASAFGALDLFAFENATTGFHGGTVNLHDGLGAITLNRARFWKWTIRRF
jgi:hypothetical protein